jgi:hypothetical protein
VLEGMGFPAAGKQGTGTCRLGIAGHCTVPECHQGIVMSSSRVRPLCARIPTTRALSNSSLRKYKNGDSIIAAWLGTYLVASLRGSFEDYVQSRH